MSPIRSFLGVSVEGLGPIMGVSSAKMFDIEMPSSGIATSGLIARYDFDDVSGTTLVDASGSLNNATFSSTPTINDAAAGDPGEKLWDAATGDRIILPDMAGTTGTFSCWIKLDSATNGAILGLGDCKALYVGMASSGLPRLQKSSTFSVYLNSKAPVAGTWFHVAATWNSSTIRWLVDDGDTLDSSQATDGTFYCNSGGDYINKANGSVNYAGHDAKYALVRMYDRVLSNAELTQLYNEGS